VLGPFAAGAAGEGLGCGAGRARGLSGGDGDLLRPPGPRPGRGSADGLVSASARAVAVQPPAACACPADQPGAAAARPLARRRRCSACRRDADRRRQLPGCAQRSEFAGLARYGRCPSKSRWVWGVRLVVLSDRRGLPLGYTLVGATELEYEALRDLSSALEPGSVIVADKGFWGRAYAASLQANEIALLTPARERTAANT